MIRAGSPLAGGPRACARRRSPRPRAKPSFDDLVANLKSPNAKTRQEAAAELGKSRRREAVAPLAALVRDPEVKVRLEVVRALRELRDLSGVPALVTSLGDGDPKIREEAIGTLVEIYAERERTGPVGRLPEHLLGRVRPLLGRRPTRRSTRRCYDGLARALRDERPGHPRRTRRSPSASSTARRALPELVAALQDPEADVRGAAATAHRQGRHRRGRQALIPLLADESTRRCATACCRRIGVLRVHEAGPALREMYEQNRKQGAGAARAGGAEPHRRPRAGRPVPQLVQDPDPERKRLAVEGLGRIADPRACPPSRRTTSASATRSCGSPTASRSRCSATAPSWTASCSSLPSRTLGTRSRGYILEMGRDDAARPLPVPRRPGRRRCAPPLCDIMAAHRRPGRHRRACTPLINDPSPNVADRANRAVERLRTATPAR